ncbi:unnamed protein product, partial [Larinioides sclopetarius]
SGQCCVQCCPTCIKGPPLAVRPSFSAVISLLIIQNKQIGKQKPPFSFTMASLKLWVLSCLILSATCAKIEKKKTITSTKDLVAAATGYGGGGGGGGYGGSG